MPPWLVGCPFQMQLACVDPDAAEGAGGVGTGRSTTRSVVTTEGAAAVGTGRSMTRVQAVAASAALSNAMVAFMRGFLLAG